MWAFENKGMKALFKNYGLFVIPLLLLPAALLTNLGVMTFIDDEAIRALVALEMDLSGNYITPTLHGAFYYNKPPLFNWILLLFFHLSCQFDELTARLPTVLALLGYGLTVFWVFRKQYNLQTGFLAAFTLITCGRILFWDSMLALIDITFSWVTFSLFFAVYYFFSRQRWWALFVVSYLLTAVGFLLKGLPAGVFQGITLLAYFSYRGSFKKLISLQHAAGIAVFALLIGAYYWVYLQYNDLDTVFATLFRESSKRTVVDHGLGRTILHLFTFPFEMVYHFMPWSLLAVYFLNRNAVRLVREDRFLEFLAVAFFSNILIYWSSPGIFPRYLLMFVPLVFGIALRLHEWHERRESWHFRFVQGAFLVLVIAIALGSWAPLFIERLSVVPYRTPVVLSLGLAMVGLLIWLLPKPERRLPGMVIALLLFRIGFNWFVIPDRNRHDYGDSCRESSKEVGRNYREEKMYVYRNTDMQPTNSFYLTRERGAIIPRRWGNYDKNALHLIDPVEYPKVSYEKVDKIYVRHGRVIFDLARLQ